MLDRPTRPLSSQGLWEHVQDGAKTTGSSKGKETIDVDALKAATDVAKQEAKALLILHQGVSKSIYPRIMGAPTSKAAWDILLNEFQGSEKNIAMKENESVRDFVSRMMEIVNQIRSLGDKLKDKKIAPKILRCLPPKFDPIVTTIEETKDLKTLSITELMGSLQAHEERIKRSNGDLEHAFQSKTKLSSNEKQFQKYPKSNIRGGGRGRSSESRFTDFKNPDFKHNSNQVTCALCKRTNHTAFDCFYKCKRCKKPTHMEKDCWSKGREEKKEEAKYIQTTEKLLISGVDSEPHTHETWFIDSGCSNHMTSCKHFFVELNESTKFHVVLGDGKKLAIEGTGTVAVKSKDGHTRHIEDVHYVPLLTQSLLSVGQLMKNGYTITFEDAHCHITHKERSVCIASVKMTPNKMFPLDLESPNESAFVCRSTLSLWYNRFAHLNKTDVCLLKQKQIVIGLPDLQEENTNCEDCIFSKSHRLPFPITATWRAQEPLELVHADLWGPAPTPSLGEMRYYLCIIDDFSRFSWIFFLKQKSEAFTEFKEFKAVAEESGHSIKRLRTDRGGEFIGDDFMTFCKDHGISRELTSPRSPEQNGVVERKNRVIAEKMRAMLQHHNLPQELWAEAVKTAIYILNRSPTKAVPGATPYEVWKKRKPNVQHLRTFGCLAFRHIPKENRNKLQMKAEKGVFVGYSLHSKAYRIYDPDKKQLYISRDVIFDEHNTWDWDQNIKKITPAVITEDYQPSNLAEDVLPPPVQAAEETQPPNALEEDNQGTEDPLDYNSDEDSSSPKRYKALTEVYQYASFVSTKEEPENYLAAATNDNWVKAMKEEMQMIKKNNTWELVPKPKNKKVVNLKWVYKIKQNEQGEVVKYKARIVAKGFTQLPGVDYTETYAPVVRMETMRAFLAIAAQSSLLVHQLDVKSAFLNGDIDEEVYVSQPEGFIEEGKEELVCRLRKALYGLKQSARAWNQKIDSYLRKNGYIKSKNDPSLYTKYFENQEYLLLCLYVDDLIFIGSTPEIVRGFKKTMKEEYEMSDLGLMKFFLGFQIEHTAGRIFINQEKYVEKILEKYGMTEANPVATPMATSVQLTQSDHTRPVSEGDFRSLIGSLMYLTNTRPDIENAVSILSRYLTKPSSDHLIIAKRVPRYLIGTKEMGLLYEKEEEALLTGYTDSDWGGDKEDRKSTSGYVFLLGSKAISWSSRKQKIVALSSAEAEFVAACSAACEGIWLQKLLKDLSPSRAEVPVRIWCDNIAAIGIGKNPVFHNRTKHIDLRYHFLKELIETKQVELIYCPTSKQLADIMTKPLPRHAFAAMSHVLVSALRGDIGVTNAEWINEEQKTKSCNNDLEKTMHLE
ncbi:hypothetical protein KSP39_PZI015291 [Platanthera zijinensis]|uniref:Integrase catalytic domain-containing protein n=1 Tax=Platanthera zijinensis TaxID=2320716 RepID=A0AAP0B9T7_9ASPA